MVEVADSGVLFSTETTDCLLELRCWYWSAKRFLRILKQQRHTVKKIAQLLNKNNAPTTTATQAHIGSIMLFLLAGVVDEVVEYCVGG